MTSICTQDEARRRRASVHFCYLCGNDITCGEETTREHIIPRAVLERTSIPNPWPLVLDVHKRCELETKRKADSLFKLWQNLLLPAQERLERATRVWDEANSVEGSVDDTSRIELAYAAVRLAAETAEPTLSNEAFYDALDRLVDVLVDTGQVSKQKGSQVRQKLAAVLCPSLCLELEHYRTTPLKVPSDVLTDGSFFPIDGFQSIQNAVWMWVRGLHALLYATFLPDNTPHLVLTPLPVFSGTSSPQPFPGHWFHAAVLTALAVADLVQKFDQINWWEDKCSFRSVWLHSPQVHDFARCIWRLEVPGPSDTGTWWGWYDLPAVPSNASRLDEMDFDSYNRLHALDD